MRKSSYNVEAWSHQGEHLLFNTASGAFAVLSPEAYQAYDRGEADDALVQAGFFTEDSAAKELAGLHRAFEEQRADHTRFVISIVPTYICNYRCPYCYEMGHNQIKGTLSAEMAGKIFDFVAGRYDAHPFETLEVQWYGGDPSLCLDDIEPLAQRFLGFCAERGIGYESMMLSNCNVIDEAAAQRIADMGVRTMLMTLDGPEEHHNKRRVAANGTNSYQRNIRAARLLRAHGVKLAASMNCDKTTLPLAREFAAKMRDEEGIDVNVAKLNDYGGCFGRGDFCLPEFDLYTHEEFARAKYDLVDKGNLNVSQLRGVLSAGPAFCNGQRDDYFVIDLLGDVYKCDGYVGVKDHVLFSLDDDPSEWKLDAITHDATSTPLCQACKLLPMCQGSCIWEREMSAHETGEMPCYPLKTTMGDYLADYRDALAGDALEGEGGVVVLVQPTE